MWGQFGLYNNLKPAGLHSKSLPPKPKDLGCVMVVHTFNLNSWEAETGDLWEFEASPST